VSFELPCGSAVAANPLVNGTALLWRAVFRESGGIGSDREIPLEFHSSERAGNGTGRRNAGQRNRPVKRSGKLESEENEVRTNEAPGETGEMVLKEASVP
jgi:hypothetical protein